MRNPSLVTGRPKTACERCKELKIRCSTTRPTCDRCLRIGYTCVYARGTLTPSKITKRPKGADLCQDRSLKGCAYSTNETSGGSAIPKRWLTAEPAILASSTDRYVGISGDLIFILAEVYFQHVYNADLLLHQSSYLDAIRTGCVNPCVVLSVCALAAKFYHDEHGSFTFRDHGFMHVWAKRAAELAFKQYGEAQSDNVVTHLNLALFWFSEGSWPQAYVHKANACSLIQLLGTSCTRKDNHDFKTAKIRRHHFWAHYLMDCHMPTPHAPEYRKALMNDLPLPSLEEDFELGQNPDSCSISAVDKEGNSIYAQIIRVMSFWADVSSLIKSLHEVKEENVAAVYVLDEELQDWWQALKPSWKLSASNLSAIPPQLLPKVLLINVAYHQCLFALHAAIMPLFAVSTHATNWNTARQLSAQIAFEHASATSELMTIALSSQMRLSTIPQFVAWSAYSACAILIPFSKSSDSRARFRAASYVQANSIIMSELAKHWRFAKLLESYVVNLINSYDKHHIVLNDEPKNLPIQELSKLRVVPQYARVSILSYFRVLENDSKALIEAGEEKLDLNVDDDDVQVGSTVISAETDASISRSELQTSTEANEDMRSSQWLQTFADDVTFAPQQVVTQDWTTWPLETLNTPQVSSIFTLAMPPWNEMLDSTNNEECPPQIWTSLPAENVNFGLPAPYTGRTT